MAITGSAVVLSLEGVRHVLLQMLVVLLCSVYWVFSCRLPFIGSPPLPPSLPPPFIIVLIIIYPIGSPLFFQFSAAGAEAGAGFFWCAELVVGLEVGQPLRCSSYLGLGLVVPATIFLGTQPPCAMKALTQD